MYGRDYPVSVTNFIENINKNIYKNQKFYKIINFPQAKIIHSGINQKSNYNEEKNPIFKRIKPTIPLEIKFLKENEAKYNYPVLDPFQLSNLTNFFDVGSIAMVKSGKKSSSSTEFFFVTDKIPELNGRYAIFGRIVKGVEILDKIDKEDYIFEIRIAD